ncbi:MAG: 3-isopropylmalate dehydratase [Melioribacteraceae bacterium]|nr:3-isopropylmalate dehydratase [Melioribacteraceae bacterium]
MNNIIVGKAFVLGDNIDTDQIIPAEHLVYSLTDPEERKKYGHYAFSGVPPAEAGLPVGNTAFIEGEKTESEFSIIIGGTNFGCGSSREHAPFALKEAGAQVILAESYARIFYRNSVDGGFIIPFEATEKLNDKIKTGDKIKVNIDDCKIINETSGESFSLRPLGDVLPIIEAGGLFEYARKADMIKK